MNYRLIAAFFIVIIATVLMIFFSTPIKGMKDTYYMIFIHPPFSWTAYIFFVISAVKGYRFLKTNSVLEAYKSYSYMSVGFIFIIYAAVSGMAWGQLYWGDIGISNMDPKFTSIIFVLIIYSAYFILRNSIEDPNSQLRMSTIYAMVCLPFATFFIFIMPRITFSLHPENPIFSWKKSASGSTGFSFGYINLTVLMLMLIGILILAFELKTIKLRIHQLKEKIGELYE